MSHNATYNNDILPLPRELEKIIVQYYPLFVISCVLPETERTCEMVAPPLSKTIIPVQIKTPKILLYQALTSYGRGHKGHCDCNTCRTLKPRYNSDVYLYAVKPSASEILCKIYNLANVHDNGNICYGKRAAIRNPRQANAVYWLAPFNVDLWSVWKKHQAHGSCPKIKHACMRRCQPVHKCQAFVNTGLVNNGSASRCEKNHARSCPNYFDPNAPRPDFRQPTPVAFFGGSPLYVRINAQTNRLEFLQPATPSAPQVATGTNVATETNSATATAVADPPVAVATPVATTPTLVAAPPLPPLSSPVKIPCICRYKCEAGCCNGKCTKCNVECRCCLQTCGHDCPCDISGQFKRHLEGYNVEADVTSDWRNMAKNICGTKFVGSSNSEEAVFISTKPEALARFDKENWRARENSDSTQPILVGFANRKGLEHWEVRVNDQVVLFKNEELNIC